MADTTHEDDVERLKSALWYAVGQMVDEESLRRSRNATPQFIGALTELVWTQIDLESFSNHAGRSTVTTDDVLLLARKNPDLHQIMEEFVQQRKAEKEALEGKAAKTSGGVSSSSTRGGAGAGSSRGSASGRGRGRGRGRGGGRAGKNGT